MRPGPCTFWCPMMLWAGIVPSMCGEDGALNDLPLATPLTWNEKGNKFQTNQRRELPTSHTSKTSTQCRKRKCTHAQIRVELEMKSGNWPAWQRFERYRVLGFSACPWCPVHPSCYLSVCTIGFVTCQLTLLTVEVPSSNRSAQSSARCLKKWKKS